MIERLSQNLNLLLNRNNLSVTILAKATNIPASTIKKIRNGSNMNPTIATLIPIAKYFSISLETLIIGEVQFNETNIQSSHQDIALHNAMRQFKLDNRVWELHNTISNFFTIYIDSEYYEIFSKGTVLMVNPKILPNHGDFIVTCKENHTTANLKQYLNEDENQYLKSMRISNDIVPLSCKYKIIGVIVKYWKILREDNFHEQNIIKN